MNCPSCACEATEVKDSRPCAEENAIRRRRLCTGCGVRFTTFEVVRVDPEGLNPRDSFKYRRAAEIGQIMHELALEDAQLLLVMARRLGGRPAVDDADQAPAEGERAAA